MTCGVKTVIGGVEVTCEMHGHKKPDSFATSHKGTLQSDNGVTLVVTWPTKPRVPPEVQRARNAALVPLMDEVLIAIEDGRDIPQGKLRQLPPWRAVMMARVALKAGCMAKEDVDALVEEARQVGGDGKLRPG